MFQVYFYFSPLPSRPAAPPANEVERAGAAAPTTAWTVEEAANKANPPDTTGKLTGKGK